MAREVTVPIPRPRPRPADLDAPAGRQIPVERGEHEQRVVMPSLHNWVEQVYRAFEQPFPTGANEFALLGVREVRRNANQPGFDDDTYEAGTRPAERGALQRRVRSSGEVIHHDVTTTFDDLLFMVWAPTTPEEGTEARVYGCTIDPAMKENSATGVPYLLEGKSYRVRPGPHWGHPQSLHIYSDTYPFILMSREATNANRVFNRIQSALVRPSTMGPTRWEFVGTENNNTFHIHWSGDYTDPDRAVTNWSSGCTVLMHGRGSAPYAEFIRLSHAAANARQIPYLVVSSSYVELPHVWAAAAANDAQRLQQPAFALRAPGLVRAPDPLAGYLPSTMTFRFAQDVLRLAADVGRLSAGVTDPSRPNLDEAMSNVVALANENPSILPRNLQPLLEGWSASRAAQRPLTADQATRLTSGLSGLGEALQSSIERACFQTVLPHEREGPR